MARPMSNNRQMAAENPSGDQVFFFPKNNPPISIRAGSREQAERILEALNKKEA